MQSGICTILLSSVVLVTMVQASSFHKPGDRYPRPQSPAEGSISSVPNVGTSNQGTSNSRIGVLARMPWLPVSTDSVRFPEVPSPRFPSNRREASVGSETWSWDWHGVQTPGVKILDYQPPQSRWGPPGRREHVELGKPIYKQQPGFDSNFRLPERDREVQSHCVCRICLIWSYQPRRFPCSRPYPKAPQSTSSLPDTTTPKTFPAPNPETTSPDLTTQPSDGNFSSTTQATRTPSMTTTMQTTTIQTTTEDDTTEDYAYVDPSEIPEPS